MRSVKRRTTNKKRKINGYTFFNLSREEQEEKKDKYERKEIKEWRNLK